MSLENGEFNDVQFWALNTKTSEKLIGDNFDTMTNGMTDSEKKAFNLGVYNAFSTFNQLATQAMDNNSIQFYHPFVDEGTEFSDDEVLAWIESIQIA